MTTALIIFLLLVGLLLILVEIFITPGFIVGIVGLILMGIGVYQTYSEYGTLAGNLVLAGTFLVSVTIVFLTLRSGAWDRLSLNETITGKTNVIDLQFVHVGDKGKTLSALRPMGNALINNKRLEVVTEGEPVPANVQIEVINIAGNKVIVKQIT